MGLVLGREENGAVSVWKGGRGRFQEEDGNWGIGGIHEWRYCK